MDKREALDVLRRLSDGLAAMFGNNCEVVVHDMNNFDNSIVHIVNGHVTDRQVGDAFKVLGLKDVDRFFSGTDLINCRAATPDQRLLKSSTFHVRGDDYHYALGVNFDYTSLAFAAASLGDLTKVGEDIDKALAAPSPERSLEQLFAEALKSNGKPVSMLNKNDRVRIVRFLEERGAFAMQRSIPFISEKLNVSRYTVYNYLKEIRTST